MAKRTKQLEDEKPPHYVGSCRDGNDIYKITEAIVTPSTIMVTWKEGHSVGSMKVTSSNGRAYSGSYRYNDDPSLRTADLVRSDKEGGDVVLVGTWEDKTVPNWRGEWTFELTPNV